MKINFNRTVQRYVVSEQGIILHTTPDFCAAQRLAGIEPEPECKPIPEDDGSGDFSDLLKLLED